MCFEHLYCLFIDVFSGENTNIVIIEEKSIQIFKQQRRGLYFKKGNQMLLINVTIGGQATLNVVSMYTPRYRPGV